MNSLIGFERWLSRSIEVVITLMFMAIFVLTVTLVILRYGFNTSIVGGNEAMNYLFIYTTALGAAASIGHGTHIRISVAVDMLPASIQRYIFLLRYLLVGFFNALMVVYSFGWIESTGGFESPVMRIPNWIVQVSVPIGCALAVVYCAMHFVLEIASPADWKERVRT